MQTREKSETGKLRSVVALLKQYRQELANRHVMHVWVFGSVARGDEHEDSDVDLVVEIAPDSGMSLTGFSHLRLELADMLGRDVDLGEWSTMRDEIVEEVKNDAVMVF